MKETRANHANYLLEISMNLDRLNSVLSDLQHDLMEKHDIRFVEEFVGIHDCIRSIQKATLYVGKCIDKNKPCEFYGSPLLVMHDLLLLSEMGGGQL